MHIGAFTLDSGNLRQGLAAISVIFSGGSPSAGSVPVSAFKTAPWTRLVGRTTHGTGDFGGMCLAKHSGGGQKEGKLKASRDVPRDRSMMDRLPCLLH
jgi:hypothetical protein